MLNQSTPTVFDYGGKTVRTINFNDHHWFIAKDVCDSLGISRTSDGIEKLDDDEKLMRKISASGQNREMWIVNESGLYNLIFRSNKPEAKSFRKWVTSEVLPAIRRNGSYQAPLPELEDLTFLIKSASAMVGGQTELAKRIGVSSSYISEIKHGKQNRYKTDSLNAIKNSCTEIIRKNGRYDYPTFEMLLEIEPKEVRTALYNKLRKGGLL